MSDFPIQPLFDRIFVVKEEEARDPGGLVRPDSVKGAATIARVVAVGPGQRSHLGEYIKPQVKVGDRVYVTEFSGYMIRYKEYNDVFVLLETEIVGVVRDV